ncbi:MAG: hypothetical protein FJZ96_11905 [Chloroflexi bacterium]|nr:hypothetical protein [Chloroflexota bacterium]
MKSAPRWLILLALLIGCAGCEQPLKPFDPTGNTGTEPPPLAVPTYPLQTPYPEQDIQFEYRAVEPGHSLTFRAIGFNFDEALRVKIIRPDGTEVVYSAYADKQGILEGTVSVADDRPRGVYTLTVTGESSGHEATGWFTMADSIIEVEDWLEFPKRQWKPLLVGELDGVDAYLAEIKYFHAPVTLVEWRYVPGAGNGGTLEIHCLQTGVGPATAVVVRSSDQQVITVNFTIECVDP